MARNGQVNIEVTADASSAIRAFDSVGEGARDMARDLEKSSKDVGSGFDSVAEGIDGSERKFRGLGDTINGTSDIMQGFKDGDIVGLAMGFADLAGGVTDFVVPLIQKLIPGLGASALATEGASAANVGFGASLTAALGPIALVVAAIAGIIAVGYLIVRNWDTIKDAAATLWDWLKTGFGAAVDFIKNLAGFIVAPYKAAFNAIAHVWNATVGQLSFHVPDWVPGIGGKGFDVPDLPTFHTGGIAGRDMLAVLQQGEQIIPRGQSSGGGTTVIVQGSLIQERDLGRTIADALRNNGLIGVTA